LGICFSWKKDGRCPKGNNCQYRHNEVCVHWKSSGSCKYDPCRFLHVEKPDKRSQERPMRPKQTDDNEKKKETPEMRALKKENERLKQGKEKMKEEAERKERKEQLRKIEEQNRRIKAHDKELQELKRQLQDTKIDNAKLSVSLESNILLGNAELNNTKKLLQDLQDKPKIIYQNAMLGLPYAPRPCIHGYTYPSCPNCSSYRYRYAWCCHSKYFGQCNHCGSIAQFS